MRARFTTSIASQWWDYPAGREVLVGGTQYGPECVPEAIGRAWLASGVLERVDAPAVATVSTPETAALAAPRPRPQRAAVRSHLRS